MSSKDIEGGGTRNVVIERRGREVETTAKQNTYTYRRSECAASLSQISLEPFERSRKLFDIKREHRVNEAILLKIQGMGEAREITAHWLENLSYVGRWDKQP